jgi:hypothetical protein
MWFIARLFDDRWRAISVDGASVPAVGSGINGDDRPDARLLIADSEPIKTFALLVWWPYIGCTVACA